MYEAVYATPDGDTTPSRFAVAAGRYGYDGVVVRGTGRADADTDFDRVRKRFDCDAVDGFEVVADSPESAAGAVGARRESRTVLLVRGGTNALNRFAVEQPRVDVLTRPFDGDGDVNHVLLNAARDNAVRVEFDFGRVLRLDGGRRVQSLRKLRKLRELVEATDAPYVVSATPTSHLQLRSPRELAAVGETLGFSTDQVIEGLAEWGRLTERNRHRRSDSFIGPGVERGRYEEDA